MAYQLKLPSQWPIHNAFHVSLLKAYKGDPPQEPVLDDPPEFEGLIEILQPEQIIRHEDELLRNVKKHSSYPLILGQPYITTVRMETKVLDDGSAYARIRSRDGKRAVQFLTVCVNHSKNKDSLRDHPLPRIRKEFHENRKFKELPKWEKQYIIGMQSELQSCNVLDPDDVISGVFEEISYVDMMSELEEIKRNRTEIGAAVGHIDDMVCRLLTLQGQVNTEGVQVEEGQGGLPKLVLTDKSGSQAEIYIFGACVTSWRLSTGKDLLFVRPDALFNGQKPISGGIPHCFPQFGPGPIQQHGFARNLPWSIASCANDGGSPSVVFELKDNKYTRDMWNYTFLATYKVSLEPNKLSTTLIVKNIDDKPFIFNSALHTYFAALAAEVVVKGLKGCKTLNKVPDPVNPISVVEEREEVTFPGFVDCIYLDAPQELLLSNGLGDVISITNKNWSDAVLWNPHTNAPGNIHKDFVCVENAKMLETLGKVSNLLLKWYTGLVAYGFGCTICIKCSYLVFPGKMPSAQDVGQWVDFLLKRQAVRGVYFGARGFYEVCWQI
ncbi:hypothetical protein L7F22_032752 [Adiantum nelumboides]|nr:hypothetical protein [Adiantum nelumboides]